MGIRLLRTRRFVELTLVCLCGIAFTTSVHAAGLLVAEDGGRLELREQDVHVTINNGIAITQVEQTFKNTENRIVEALYTFPVPKGASVSDFSMWINGKEMIGEVVEKQKAREIYESYKRRNIDPGLLEQVDYKTFEMRIFPIAADAEQRVRVTYYQQLDYDLDRATYVYPLATVSHAEIQQKVEGRFTLNARILSEVPIVELDSPSHGADFAVVAHSAKFHEASFEATAGDLSRDFVLSYQISRPSTGVDIVTSRPPGEDGYFMMTITAGDELSMSGGNRSPELGADPNAEDAMDYVFVIDISGSMATESKLKTSRDAVSSFVESLSPHDRIELLVFNVAPTSLFGQLRNANADSIRDAKKFLRDQGARGSTSLAPAMNMAYRYGDPDRPLNVVILSDGMTEQGEVQQLHQLIRQRPANATVFAVGVGNEVNRPLLSQLAEDAGGLAAFISREDDFERQGQAFRRKLTRPAGANVELSIAGVDAYDIVPAKLPNLYHGMPIRVFGRYRGGDLFDVRLNAEIRGKPMTIVSSEMAPPRSQPEIERMWASAKITELLRDADRSGSLTSVRDQVVALGEDYSIATQFTSFLVLENNSEYQRWKIDRRNRRRLGRDRDVQLALRKRLDHMRDESFTRLGPKQSGRSAQQLASSAPRKFQKLTVDRPAVHNTPEPSSGLLLLLMLGPVVHWLRIQRRHQ